MSDGRIVLRRDKLKVLRRNLGASQERVALLCAERGLCVSIASIKRAETRKKILYRTARDLAAFYQVDIESLIESTGDSGHNDGSGILVEGAGASGDAVVVPHGTSSALVVKREFVLLGCHMMATTADVAMWRDLSADLKALASQYEARQVIETPGNVIFGLGTGHTRGDEIQKALYFGLKCLRLCRPLCGKGARLSVVMSRGLLVSPKGEETTDPDIGQHDLQQNEKLARAAPADGFYVSDDIRHAVSAPFGVRRIESSDLGRAIWQIEFNGFQCVVPELSPFVGRRLEITLLKAILETTREESTPQIAHLVGVAGIGKSRLKKEFFRITRWDGFQLHHMQLYSFHVEQHQRAIPQLLRSLLGITRDQMTLSGDEIKAFYSQRLLCDSSDMPVLCSLLNWPVPDAWSSLLATMSPETLLEAQCQVIGNILRARAEQSAVLITIEDYHWAEEEERRHIDALVRSSSGLAVIIVLIMRPGEAAQRLSLTHESYGLAVTRINLGPLPALDSTRLSKHFAEIDDDYRRECVEKAQGNPLFLEQLLKDRGQTMARGLPFTLNNLIASRLESMAPEDQLAARAASVIGQQFSLSLLQKLIGNPDYDPTPLVTATIVNGTGSHYSFNHALIAEGIYQTIAGEDQSRLHCDCANWYQYDPVLQCQHLLKGKHPRAVEKIIPAVEYLISRYQFTAAQLLVKIGLAMEAQCQNKPRLFELAADVYLRLGDTNNALAAFQSMRRHAQKPVEQAAALIGSANCLNTLECFEEAMSALTAAYNISINNNLTSQLSRVFYLKGNFLFPASESPGLRRCSEQGSALRTQNP